MSDRIAGVDFRSVLMDCAACTNCERRCENVSYSRENWTDANRSSRL